MRESPRITVALLVFLLIFLLGAGLRFYRLGAAPLSEAEAAAALNALALAEGRTPAAPGAHPGHAALTAVFFFLFEDTNFIARLAPALAGVSMVLTPWMLRRRLGTVTALAMAAGLALDPLLVGISRLADGPMLAAGALSLAAALRIAKSGSERGFGIRIATGVLFGLALLAGPAIWIGLLILVFAGAISRFAGIGRLGEEDGATPVVELAAGALTLLLAGTVLLRAPQGLDSFAGSIIAFIGGWQSSLPVPPLRLLIALGAYHGWVVLFSGLHLWISRSGQDAVQKSLLIYAMVALAVLLLYPGRQVADLVWIAAPLWATAAGFLSTALQASARPLYRPALLTSALAVLGISFWINLAGYISADPLAPNNFLRLMVLGGTIVLAGLSILLTAMGWEAAAARSGTFWALAFALAFNLVAGVFGSGHRSGQERRDLWVPSPAAGEAELLTGTLNQLGDWSMGDPAGLDVSVLSVSPSVAWVLRDFSNVSYDQVFSAGELPSAIVTDTENENFRIASAYRGQGLTWRVHVLWNELDGRAWLRWLVFREAPAVHETIVVWARADIFLAGEEIVFDDPGGEGAEQPPPEEIIPLEDVEDVLPDE